MNSTRNRTIAALLASSALVVGLAACGTTPTETAGSAAASTGATPSPSVTLPSNYEISTTLDRGTIADPCHLTSDEVNTLSQSLRDEYDIPGDKAYEHVVEYASGECADKESAANAAATAKATAAAEAKAKAKAAAAAKARITNAKAPSKRTWAKVVKNPDAYTGKVYVIYGQINQFDAATGTDTFLADTAANKAMSYGFFDGENTMVNGTEKQFADFVEDDVFKATVEVTGSYSYDTQIGGNTTVPLLKVLRIKRI